MDVSGFESNELWVFVVSIVDALMTPEVFASFVKRYKRLVSVLFTSHFVVDCFSCFLNDGIRQAFGLQAGLVEAAHQRHLEVRADAKTIGVLTFVQAFLHAIIQPSCLGDKVRHFFFCNASTTVSIKRFERSLEVSIRDWNRTIEL